jgi:hypothetical protein
MRTKTNWFFGEFFECVNSENNAKILKKKLPNFGNHKIEKEKEKENLCSKHEKIGMCSY